MSKVICSPGSYVQEKGAIKKLAEYSKIIGGKNAYIITGNSANRKYKADIEKSFKDNDMACKVVLFGGECSDVEIKKHQDQLGDADIIFGIGGGKTLDTTKAIAFYSKIPMVIVPTAASSDAPCSRLSVVYTEDHEFDYYLPLNKNPDMVIMDTDVIANAPVKLLVAGIGDALATYYEAMACEKANAVTMAGGTATKASIALATLCLDTLLEDGLKAKAAVENKVVTKALENVIEANTYLSGVGFESSGLAAAHAIHNGLTVIEETHDLLHGEKVAFGTICQMVLENDELDEIQEIVDFCRALGLPTNFKDMGMENVSDEKLMEAAELACAEGDTMENMPFDVTPGDVVAAMKTADKLSQSL